MDLNDIRNVVTLLSFVIFGAIVGWAMSRKNKARFDEAELLPFLDEPEQPASQTRTETRT